MLQSYIGAANFSLFPIEIIKEVKNILPRFKIIDRILSICSREVYRIYTSASIEDIILIPTIEPRPASTGKKSLPLIIIRDNTDICCYA